MDWKELEMGKRGRMESEMILKVVKAGGDADSIPADAEAATTIAEDNPQSPPVDTSKMTRLQGQYLAYIHNYMKMSHGVAPAQTDLQRYFETAPPNVHNMILRLESLGFLARTPGKARALRVLVDPAQIPPLE